MLVGKVFPQPSAHPSWCGHPLYCTREWRSLSSTGSTPKAFPDELPYLVAWTLGLSFCWKSAYLEEIAHGDCCNHTGDDGCRRYQLQGIRAAGWPLSLPSSGVTWGKCCSTVTALLQHTPGRSTIFVLGQTRAKEWTAKLTHRDASKSPTALPVTLRF